MLTRLKMFWSTIRDSLWFIPAVLTLLAIGLALGLVHFEAAYDTTRWTYRHLIIGGSVDGAREVLSTVAGSLITVTGVVFSVTIVALQLASTQFTPRVLRNFMADRSNQVVLGVFIATFTYTLLVLRVVRSIDEGQEFVPPIAVSLAILFALASIAFLIHFIHHVARSIQAAAILGNITAAALEQTRNLFPVEIGGPEEPHLPDSAIPSKLRQPIGALHEGYLQAVDSNSLFHLGQQQQLLIEMVQPIGAFILRDMPLGIVWSDRPIDDEIRRRIRDAFLIGEQRTPEQDLEFYLLEISDIAVKALSPGINDPTTARHCIDRLTQILLALGKRRPPSPLRTESGQIHFIAHPTNFERATSLAFTESCTMVATIRASPQRFKAACSY